MKELTEELKKISDQESSYFLTWEYDNRSFKAGVGFALKLLVKALKRSL